jgi:hypothetical protein
VGGVRRVVDPYQVVPVEHIFHFRDGKKAHNIAALRDAIAVMGADEYAHHVDDANNDFANWVEFVYKNKPLADDLRLVSSPKAAVEVLDAELGDFGGEKAADREVEDLEVPKPSGDQKPSKQLFEAPEISKPPQIIKTATGEHVPSISTHAVHHFIIKEWAWGFILGLLLGFVLAASLFHFGAL